MDFIRTSDFFTCFFFLFTPKTIDISGWTLHFVRADKERTTTLVLLHCHLEPLIMNSPTLLDFQYRFFRKQKRICASISTNI
jgi:hypothetical protein